MAKKKVVTKKKATEKSAVRKKTVKKTVETPANKATVKKKATKKAATTTKTGTKQKGNQAIGGFQRYELIEGKSSKFWEIKQDGPHYTVRYGRIGTDGQSKTKDMGSNDTAASEVKKLIETKIKKGYDPVGSSLAYSKSDRANSVQETTKNVSNTKPGKNPLTLEEAQKILKEKRSSNLQKFDSIDATVIQTNSILKSLICKWDFNLLLFFGERLSGSEESLGIFLRTLSKLICKDGGSSASEMLEDFFGMPIDHRESEDILSQGPGSLIFEAFIPELSQDGRINFFYQDDECGDNFVDISTTDGITLCSTSAHPWGEGRAELTVIPSHVQSLCNLYQFCISEKDIDAMHELELAWSISDCNFLPDDRELFHEFIVYRCDSFTYTAKWVLHKERFAAFAFILYAESSVAFNENWSPERQAKAVVSSRKEPETLFKWKPDGVRIVEQIGNGYLKSRETFPGAVVRNGSVVDLYYQEFGIELPWTFNKRIEWEVTFPKQKKSPISYGRVSNRLKELLLQFLLTLRSEARKNEIITTVPMRKTMRDGWKEVKYPVIEGLVNHILMCMALSRHTPKSMIDRLKLDEYSAVSECAKSSQQPPKRKPPKQQMAELMQKVVDGVGVVRGKNNTKLSKEVAQLTAIANKYSEDMKQLDNLCGGKFDGLLGCALAVGVTQNWISLTAKGERLVSDTAECIKK